MSAQLRINATKRESQPLMPADSNDSNLAFVDWCRASRTTPTLAWSGWLWARESAESFTSRAPGETISTAILKGEMISVINRGLERECCAVLDCAGMHVYVS